MFRHFLLSVAKRPIHIGFRRSTFLSSPQFTLKSKVYPPPLFTNGRYLSSASNKTLILESDSFERNQHSTNGRMSIFAYLSLIVCTYFVYKKNHSLYAKELPTSPSPSLSSPSYDIAQLPTPSSDENKPTEDIVPGLEISSLPTYSRQEVSKHNDPKNPEVGVWISYKAGVYDVTSFVSTHPGGDNILLGAGNSIEPFWEVYGQHKTQQVFQLLESFRIGNLREEDRLKASEVSQAGHIDYIPERNAALIVHHEKPFNAESPAELLMHSFLTTNDNFFVRNHLSVPEVDLADYQLEIEGLTLQEPRSLTLEQLKSLFAKHTVTSVIQCAGNRRDALNEIKEVKGIPWGVGAIGNAQWSGAKLVEVLRYCGANLEDPSIEHVQFEGLDLDATATPYGASVPADKALNPMNEFILAYEMNGEPIPADHGFPVRLIAPGIVGARNVKWLGKIILSEEESHSHWQRNDYKSFPSSQQSATSEEFATAQAIQELPITSAICTPTEGKTVPISWKQNGDRVEPVVEVTGYAWSGGGRSVIRVDLSLDGGNTWTVAELTQEEPKKSLHHTYSWTTWKANLPLQTGQLYKGNKLNIICRSFDSSYNVQPKEAKEIWNFRGLLNNSWHRVSVTLA